MDILLSPYFNSCNPASRRIARLLSFFITTMNSFWETNHISDSSSYNSFSTRMNVPSSLCVPNSIGSPPTNTFMGPFIRCHRPTNLLLSTMVSLLSLLLLVKVTLSNSFMMSFLGMTGYSPWKFLSPPFAHLNKTKFLLLLLLPSWEFMQLRYHILRVL